MISKKDYIAENFYSTKYKDQEWLNQREKDAIALLERINSVVRFNSKNIILDAGCGSGDMGKVLIRKHNAKVYGIDMNKVAIRQAKSFGVHAKLADLDGKWPFTSKTFDFVIGAEIIEHVVNPDNFLREANRVLKNNGLVILTTPNLAAWLNRFIFLFGYQPFFLEASTVDKTIGLSFTRKLTPNRMPLGHIRCFTLKALKDLLDLHGYKIVLIKGSTVYYFPKYLAPLDYFFSFFPSLSTDLIIVAKK